MPPDRVIPHSAASATPGCPEVREIERELAEPAEADLKWEESKSRLALRYAALGWAVLPLYEIHAGACACGNLRCRSPGKHPRIRHGVKGATTDAERVEEWWRRWPNANIGVATGTASGLWVLDVDPRNGGEESFDCLIEQVGPLPDTVVQLTGGGGRHYLFALPDGMPVRSISLADGLDVKGDGGYIVVEPSDHISSRRYEWEGSADPLHGHSVVAAPLLERLVTAREGPAEAVQRIPSSWTPALAREIECALISVPNDDRETWLQVGMALHSTGGGLEAFDLWEKWSRTSVKYDRKDQRRVWNSFDLGHPGGTTIKSLFRLARTHGWAGSSTDSGIRDSKTTRPAPEAVNDMNRRHDDPLGWLRDYKMTDDQIAELKSPEWIYPDLIIRGHLVLIVAEPNGGKTTLFRQLAGGFVDKGYRVIYINADIAGSDAAKFAQQAEDERWDAILPDCSPGRSIKNVVSKLREMNQSERDLSEMIFIFDTLKKLGDVISKSSMRELLALLRSLTAKGATIICLGHTNKYSGADGKPVYEGVGDLRADVDELIYLLPKKNADGSMTVSTSPDKVRGDFQPITFLITPDRRVERLSKYVDVHAERLEENRFRVDLAEITVIEEALSTGCTKQCEIVDYCKGQGVSSRRVRSLLDRYREGPYQRWKVERLGQRNALTYDLIDHEEVRPQKM